MEPTIGDVILACVWGLPCVLFLLACILPINWDCFEKCDPYENCPKEEDEW